MRRRRSTSALLSLIAVLVLAGACGHAARPKLGAPVPLPTTTTTAFPVFLVASVKPEIKSVPIYAEPGAAAPKLQLANPDDEYKIRRVFLVAEQQGTEWVRVNLPVRPNGSTGWVKASDVEITPDQWRIRIDVAARRVTVWNGADVVLSEPVAVGKASTPTPVGQFYVAQNLVVPSFQHGAYGPFAFGLSAHSNVYTTFGGGDGQVGLHGTGDTSSIGKDTSNGCIRMSNDGITKLYKLVPLGTPVEIA